MIEIHVYDNIILYDEETVDENELLKTYIEIADDPESCKIIILPYDGVINDAIRNYSRLEPSLFNNITRSELEDWIAFKSYLLYVKAENKFIEDVLYMYDVIYCTTVNHIFKKSNIENLLLECLKLGYVESIDYIRKHTTKQIFRTIVDKIYNETTETIIIELLVKFHLININELNVESYIERNVIDYYLKNYETKILDILLDDGKVHYNFILLIIYSSCVLLLDYCLKHEYMSSSDIIENQSLISSMNIIDYLLENNSPINIGKLFELYRTKTKYKCDKSMIFITKYKTNTELINYLELHIDYTYNDRIEYVNFLLFMTNMTHVKIILKPCFDLLLINRHSHVYNGRTKFIESCYKLSPTLFDQCTLYHQPTLNILTLTICNNCLNIVKQLNIKQEQKSHITTLISTHVSKFEMKNMYQYLFARGKCDFIQY